MVSRNDADGLLRLVAKRDREAFTRLVALYDSDLLRFCYMLSRDVRTAEEATQSAWLKLWLKPPSLRDPQRLRSWLLSVAANEARQSMRRQRLGRIKEMAATARIGRDDHGLEARIDLDRVLAGLSTDERELIALRYALGMSSTEIGRHLGVGPEGARTRLHRLLVKIRKELVDD